MFEFFAAADFPQKIQINAIGERLRCFEKSADCGFFELQQHIARFNFCALAVQGFNLKRRGVVGEDGADFKAAILFEENIHGESAGKRSASLPEGPQWGKADTVSGAFDSSQQSIWITPLVWLAYHLGRFVSAPRVERDGCLV